MGIIWPILKYVYENPAHTIQKQYKTNLQQSSKHMEN